MAFLLVLIYLSFISLGLPDSLLGSAWPVMRVDLGADMSLAGVISMVVAGGTVISSYLSTRLIRRFGTGRVTTVSVLMTGLALLGFSFAPAYWVLLLLAVPLGLGAGAVDSALNNFVALHYKAKHMNWLHCFWGIGATAGPMIMAAWLAKDSQWRGGYLTIAIIQCALSMILILTLPAWNKAKKQDDGEEPQIKALSLKEAVSIPLAKQTLLSLFCYCSIELTIGLWGASFATGEFEVSADRAAAWVSAFYLGITLGRAVAGFISIKLNNLQMTRLGEAITLLGVILLFLPIGEVRVPIAFVLAGLGCAPIYPAILHQTPKTFGEENSQAMMGIQMAFAYVGSTFMPPLFGFLAGIVGIGMLPVFLAAALGLMILCTEWVKHGYEKRDT